MSKYTVIVVFAATDQVAQVVVPEATSGVWAAA